jgi:hypothetical protein
MSADHPERKQTVRNLSSLMLLVLCLGSAYGQNSRCELPAQLSRTLARQWKGWRLMQLSDLRRDDQNLWVKKWGSLCPGLAAGHFLSSKATDDAISLIDPENEEQAVILATPQDHGGFVTQIISPPSRVAAYAVVHALPPGKYSEVEGGSTVNTSLDSIAVETIEAGMTMFYENRGSFHSLELEE